MDELIEDALAKGAKLVTGGETRQHAHAGDRHRPRHAGHAHLSARRASARSSAIVRVDGRGAGDRASPTTPTTACPPRSSARDIDAGLRGRAADRVRHLPRQRPDRARRGADAVRRRQGSAATAASAARRRSTPSPSCAGSPSRTPGSTIRSDSHEPPRQPQAACLLAIPLLWPVIAWLDFGRAEALRDAFRAVTRFFALETVRLALLVSVPTISLALTWLLNADRSSRAAHPPPRAHRLR